MRTRVSGQRVRVGARVRGEGLQSCSDLGGPLLVKDEHAASVPADAAVVGGGEDGEQHAVVRDLEAALGRVRGRVRVRVRISKPRWAGGQG